MRSRLAFALIALLGSATTMSCKVNEYCLENCGVEDGGTGDGPTDAPTDGDGGTTDADGGPCVPTGNEVCDNKDNDCDGAVDEGSLPTIGDPCDNQQGECAGGVKLCTAGFVTCSKNPSAEVCDLKDNDCNGSTDENDPGGGAFCGTDQGECVRGTLHCNTTTGVVQCGLNCGTVNAVDCPIGGVTAPFGTNELCDGKDNDCDGDFDEDVSQQALCGQANCQCSGGPLVGNPNEGECQVGQLKCDGAGGTVCAQIPGQGPPTGPGFEACDNKDNDCDGTKDENTDLQNDPTNCGSCGNVCDLTHAFEGCASGECTVLGCEATFHDNNGLPADGCEFGPCTITSSVEVCNGIDDDCNPATGNNPPAPCGNCAENIAAPANFCVTKGACAGATASCQGTLGFQCNYSGDVELDGNGNVASQETLCDGIDNDCDGIVDEGEIGLGNDCLETGKQGICQGSGTIECVPGDPSAAPACLITTPGGTASASETCNELDDDCDGKVDEGAETGDLLGQEWVTIPGTTTQIMKYEASQPDATATANGTSTRFACSKKNVMPWTNVTYPQAVAACSSIGARLCTETEWQDNCMPLIGNTTIPGPADANANTFTFVEAEDFFANTTIGGATRAWTAISPPGFNGTKMMQVPQNGFFQGTIGNALAQSSRLDYRFNLLNATSYFVWARMKSVAVQQRPSTPATQTLAPSSNVATQIGDLVIVVTWSRNTSNTNISHTLQTGFTEIASQDLQDGNGRGRLSVAFKVATAAGVQTYQAYTAANGTNLTSFAGLIVMAKNTFSTTGIAATAVADTGSGAPNPPVTASVSTPHAAFAIGAWHFTNGTNASVTAPTGFTEEWEMGNGLVSELSVATRNTLHSSGTLDPGSFGDNVGGNNQPSLNGTVAMTLLVPVANIGTSVYMGLTAGTAAGAATQTMAVNIDNQTQWVRSAQITTTAAGTHTLSFYLREDGLAIDTIALTRSSNGQTPSLDSAWSYENNPRTAQDTTCNAEPLGAGGTLKTGSLPSCFANHGTATTDRAFDQSGNVKEWALARSPNQNPIRGGSSNNAVLGTSCELNFTSADDDFFFPNVGFRCCR